MTIQKEENFHECVRSFPCCHRRRRDYGRLSGADFCPGRYPGHPMEPQSGGSGPRRRPHPFQSVRSGGRWPPVGGRFQRPDGAHRPHHGRCLLPDRQFSPGKYCGGPDAEAGFLSPNQYSGPSGLHSDHQYLRAVHLRHWVGRGGTRPLLRDALDQPAPFGSPGRGHPGH